MFPFYLMFWGFKPFGCTHVSSSCPSFSLFSILFNVSSPHTLSLILILLLCCVFFFFFGFLSTPHTLLFFLLFFLLVQELERGSWFLVASFHLLVTLCFLILIVDDICCLLLWVFKVVITCKLFSSFPLSSFLLICFLFFSSQHFLCSFFSHLDECVSVWGVGLGFWLSSLTSQKWYSCSFDSLCFNFATRMWIFNVVCVITNLWQSRL